MTAFPELRSLIDPNLGPILIKPVDPDTILAEVKAALSR